MKSGIDHARVAEAAITAACNTSDNLRSTVLAFLYTAAGIAVENGEPLAVLHDGVDHAYKTYMAQKEK